MCVWCVCVCVCVCVWMCLSLCLYLCVRVCVSVCGCAGVVCEEYNTYCHYKIIILEILMTFVVVDLLWCGVLTLVCEIRRYRNDCYYYLLLLFELVCASLQTRERERFLPVDVYARSGTVADSVTVSSQERERKNTIQLLTSFRVSGD